MVLKMAKRIIVLEIEKHSNTMLQAIKAYKLVRDVQEAQGIINRSLSLKPTCYYMILDLNSLPQITDIINQTR